MKGIVRKLLGAFGYEIRSKNSTGISALTEDASKFTDDPFRAQEILIAKSDPTIFDVGAHDGQTTRKFLNVFPNAQVFCFEPFPDSLHRLEYAVGNLPNVTIVGKAVSNRDGSALLFVNEFSPTNSLLPRPREGRRYYPKRAGHKTTLEVGTVTLDTFMRERKLEKVDILKFDIQGGELNALRGARELLSSGYISVIYSEIMFASHYKENPLFHEIWQYLLNFGYSLFDVYDLHRASNGQLRYGDAIFVSEKVRHEVLDRFPDEP